MTGEQPPNGGLKLARRDRAKLGGSSLRSLERACFVQKRVTSDVWAAIRAGTLNLNRAEKIARLPRDQQPAALEEALNQKPPKRPPWELQHDVDRLISTINRLSRRWTAEDRILMVGFLHDLARQLVNTTDVADAHDGSESVREDRR